MKEKVFVNCFFPDVVRAGSFKLEDILRIKPHMLRMEYAEVTEDMGSIVSFGKVFFSRNKYYFKTSYGNKIDLEFGRRDKGEKLILSFPQGYDGCSRDLLEEAYGGQCRGKV